MKVGAASPDSREAESVIREPESVIREPESVIREPDTARLTRVWGRGYTNASLLNVYTC